LIPYCILKAIVGVGLIDRSATVVLSGMQSHCGTPCFQHEKIHSWVLRQISHSRNLLYSTSITIQ
jgi:hypothetical protein